MTSDSPMLGRKPRKSSMLINTALEEDEDYYEDEHDDFEDNLEKENEGNTSYLLTCYYHNIKII